MWVTECVCERFETYTVLTKQYLQAVVIVKMSALSGLVIKSSAMDTEFAIKRIVRDKLPFPMISFIISFSFCQHVWMFFFPPLWSVVYKIKWIFLKKMSLVMFLLSSFEKHCFHLLLSSPNMHTQTHTHTVCGKILSKMIAKICDLSVKQVSEDICYFSPMRIYHFCIRIIKDAFLKSISI